ncbi:protein of unknown function [Methylocella tundrae]|uniref:Uncharacterized protein n=1 Tax=Methylocella tundrae TaxID=227605 RepID=A0A4U8Z616_METTU|nr:protein of unknown function [Methylocella tundrae]
MPSGNAPWRAPKTAYVLCGDKEFADFAPEKAMSPEERQLLTGLFDRIQSAGANPRDKEAEAFIEDAVKALPYAPYLLTQTTIVQDQALRAANDRLQQLEAQVRDLEQRAAQPQQGGGSFLGGLGSLFGGGNPQPSPPPQQPRAPFAGLGPAAAAGRLAAAATTAARRRTVGRAARRTDGWRLWRRRPHGRPNGWSRRRLPQGSARSRGWRRRRCSSRRFNQRLVRRPQ